VNVGIVDRLSFCIVTTGPIDQREGLRGNEFSRQAVDHIEEAVLGRLRLQMGESQSAREAFAQAAKIVEQIAANVSDEKLQAIFLNSALVREVLEATHVLDH
jgi:hypothetical protein